MATSEELNYQKLLQSRQQNKHKFTQFRAGLERQRVIHQQARKVQAAKKAPGQKKQDDLSFGEKAKSLLTVFSAVDLIQDIPYLFIFLFSILADVFTLIPYVGNVSAFFFSMVIWVLYFFAGHFSGGKRVFLKVGSNAFGQISEIILTAINALPFFTAMAIINYVLILLERKEKQVKKIKQKRRRSQNNRDLAIA